MSEASHLVRLPSVQTRGVVLNVWGTLYDMLSPAMLLFQEGTINRRASRLLELRADDRVLDVGCATGGMTLEAARRVSASAGGMAVGVDASARMLERARRQVGRQPCRFELAAAERLPFAAGTFSKAVSTMFFHHLRLEDKLAALREIARVLTSAGVFVLVDVDAPRTWLGGVQARSGAWLFEQPELRENIEGKLPGLFAPAGFAECRRAATDLGYIATYVLRKERR